MVVSSLVLTPERALLLPPVLYTQPSTSLSPRHAAVVLQEKNLVSEVMGEPVVTEPNLCLCHLCRTSPATPVGQEPAAGAFHNVQTFIEGVSSVAAGSASSPSPAWLHLCRGWGGAGKHLYSHQDGEG